MNGPCVCNDKPLVLFWPSTPTLRCPDAVLCQCHGPGLAPHTHRVKAAVQLPFARGVPRYVKKPAWVRHSGAIRIYGNCGSSGCSPCLQVGECVVNEEHACKGAQHRAGYEGFARCDLHEFVAAGAGRNGLAGGKPRASVPVAPAASEYCTGFGSCSASSSDEESDSKEQPKLQQQQAEDSLPTETEGSIANSATQQESLLGFGAFGLE